MTSITFTAPSTMVNKVSAIKAIRTLTGMGLKEAKDASERPGMKQTFSVQDFSAYLNPKIEFENQIRVLASEGFIIGHSVNLLLQELRNLGAEALKQGEDDLANEILQLVLAEKLRRNIYE